MTPNRAPRDCGKCGVRVLDGLPWCEQCGPPWRHVRGCACAGCEGMGNLPAATFDLLVAMFSHPERRAAARGRLTAEMFRRVTLALSGQELDEVDRGEHVIQAGRVSAQIGRHYAELTPEERARRRRRFTDAFRRITRRKRGE